jgi:GPH family glycoside/pentoside/hexuronide:cation symporter
VEKDNAGNGNVGKVPFWRTICYGFGNAAGLLTYWTFTYTIQYFYADVKGIPSEWVGVGLFAFSFWNAINDPIAGWLSDRTSTRWGRRRFYIGILAIPTSIAFALVWLPPFEKGNNVALMVYFLVIISIYDMLQSIVTLNQDALFPEMYLETGERASGSSARQLIGFMVGTGLAVALTPTIYGTLGWGALAVLWGTLAAIMYFVSLIGIRENPAFAQQEMVPWREQIRIVFRNRTFMIVLGINFMMRFILAALLAVLPFFAKYVLYIDEEDLTSVTAPLFVTSGISVLVWQFAVRRLGTRASMMIPWGSPPCCAAAVVLNGVWTTRIVLALLGCQAASILGPGYAVCRTGG